MLQYLGTVLKASITRVYQAWADLTLQRRMICLHLTRFIGVSNVTNVLADSQANHATILPRWSYIQL